jgi:hypothetical protein
MKFANNKVPLTWGDFNQRLNPRHAARRRPGFETGFD